MLRRVWASPQWQTAQRLADRFLSAQLSLFAAGIAFFGLMAIFPSIAVVATIYGLVADVTMVQRTLDPLRGIVPPAAFDILAGRLAYLISRDSSGLGFGAMLGTLLAIWSAASGTKALITALNYDYAVLENRGFFRRTGTALVFTVGGIVLVTAVLAVIIGVPAVLRLFYLPQELIDAVVWVPWTGIGVIVIGALTVLYRYGPSRGDERRLLCELPGALVATILWLFISVGFSLYVAHFGSYDETFGPISAVIVLLMWFYLSGYAICIGAELNREMSRRPK